MESWHLSYAEIMDMPLTRRHRMVKKKIDLEQKRQDKANADAAQSRSRLRR